MKITSLKLRRLIETSGPVFLMLVVHNANDRICISVHYYVQWKERFLLFFVLYGVRLLGKERGP